ncbi:hypothetical protein OC846_006410 [Tilletia horrida]|uniref:Carboxylic ester hydrolase n=1 Tax=Tilletia horrida TaxID=155126 RepID=A0AAN6GIR1_9BASI|nr:hypothetical protein OC846_006410 [Tilletia horrida]
MSALGEAVRIPERRQSTDPLLLVNTTSGMVRGSKLTNSYAYLGIPYGNPTSGSSRFRPATPVAYSSSTIDATNFGLTCPQYVDAISAKVNAFIDIVAPPVSQQSENCLSINVWTKTSTRSNASSHPNGSGGAAVLLWIYGGGFQYGGSNSEPFNFQNFVEAQDDVILVSFNYRTSIFGFPLSPQIRAMDANIGWNRGLEDRDLAIKWVANNIAAFGGDPKRITLFGESAGGASADAWAFANENNTSPLVQSVIIQSGAVSGLDIAEGDIQKNWTAPTSKWNQVANHSAVNCGVNDNAAQLQCMQQVPFTSLLTALNQLNISFGPAADGFLYFSDFKARSAAGRFARVPTLIGSNSDEATILTGLWDSNTALMLSESQVVTPLIFTCPARQEAADRVSAGVPTYRYHPALMAYHSAETPIVFNTFPAAYLGNKAHPVTIPAAQRQVSAFMQGAWAAFARDPVNGLPNYGWPRYSPNTATMAQIALNNSGQTVYQPTDQVDLDCNAVIPVGGSVYQLLQQLASY